MNRKSLSLMIPFAALCFMVEAGSAGNNLPGFLSQSVKAAPLAQTKEKKPISLPSMIRRGETVMRSVALIQVAPQYPEAARQANIGGPVKVEIVVDETGTVTDAHVLNGNPALKPAVEAAARQWKFKTTYLNNIPVKVTCILGFRFSLKPTPRVFGAETPKTA